MRWLIVLLLGCGGAMPHATSSRPHPVAPAGPPSSESARITEQQRRVACEGQRSALRRNEGYAAQVAARMALHDCLVVDGVTKWEREAAETAQAEEKKRKREEENARIREERARIEAEEAARAAAEWADFEAKSADPKFRSAVGYGNTRWGMTLAEVRRADRGGKMDSDMYVVDRRIAYWSAKVAYVFHSDRLTNVTVVLPERADITVAVDDYVQAKQMLVEKYGAPHVDEEHERYPAATIVSNIGLGELKLEASWKWIEEEAVVVCKKSGLGARTLIVYVSRELLPLVERTQDSRRARDLSNF